MHMLSQFFAWFGLLCAIGFALVCIVFGPSAYRFVRDEPEFRAYVADLFWRALRWLLTPLRWVIRGIIGWWIKRAGDLAGLVLVVVILVGLWVTLVMLIDGRR